MRIKLYTPAPRDVYNKNLNRFILENLAGIETSCLIPGISLPTKVVIALCFLK